MKPGLTQSLQQSTASLQVTGSEESVGRGGKKYRGRWETVRMNTRLFWESGIMRQPHTSQHKPKSKHSHHLGRNQFAKSITDVENTVLFINR